jgi:D-sedoheptulose 7-phosphate isomerase
MAGSICHSAKSYLSLVKGFLSTMDERKLEDFAGVLFGAWQTERQVFVFGNGGSALTASHHVYEFLKTAAVSGQDRLRAYSLVDSIGNSTAAGDDPSHNETFTFPLEAYAKPGDIAVAISDSGDSASVLRACEWARANGLAVVALTGFTGGKLKDLADIHINVPSDNFGVIEDLHLTIGHAVAQMLKTRIMEDTVMVSTF